MSTPQTTPPTTPALEGLRQSRVGKVPVAIPKGVTVTLKDGRVEVKGPKGTLSRAVPPNVAVSVDAGNVLVLPTIAGRDGARFQGLTRSLINGMVEGVGTGFTKTLQLVGTGYRAELKGQILHLALGLSHPIAFPLPAGIKAEIPGDSKGTIIIVTGSDKELIGQTVAKIRSFRPPEPYGGKGVRFKDERVREKAGKAGKGSK